MNFKITDAKVNKNPAKKSGILKIFHIELKIALVADADNFGKAVVRMGVASNLLIFSESKIQISYIHPAQCQSYSLVFIVIACADGISFPVAGRHHKIAAVIGNGRFIISKACHQRVFIA